MKLNSWIKKLQAELNKATKLYQNDIKKWYWNYAEKFEVLLEKNIKLY